MIEVVKSKSSTFAKLKINPLQSLVTSKTRMPIAGYGACRSCGCTGYKKSKNGDNYCSDCGHHYSQHR